VSIAVEMFPAHKSNARPGFRQIHEPSGKPVNYEKVVKGIGPVDPSEIRKGFEYEKGQFVLLGDEDIDAVRLETKKTVELTQFVDASEIQPIYFDSAYFLVPADELAEDAFRVVRDALAETGRVGLGQLALRGREYLVAVQPMGKGMTLATLHYQDEVRRPEAFFAQISAEKSDEELLAIAKQLIGKKTAPFDPAAFTDHYQAALRELIETRIQAKGGTTAKTAAERPRHAGTNVVDLMAALKKSLEGPGQERSARAGRTKRAASRTIGEPAASRPRAKSGSERGAAKPSATRKKAS